MGTQEMSVENGHTGNECGNRVTHCRVRAEMSDHEDSSKGSNA